MKRIGIKIGIVLILLLAIKANAFSQNVFKQRLDSIVSEWSKNIYSYDDKGNNTLNAGYYWSDDNWIKDYKFEYAYDNNGNQTLLIHYNGDYATNNWKANHKFESMYDNNGKLTSRIYYDYNLKDSTKDEYTYDNNGNKTLEIRYTWDNTTNKWRGITKSESTYYNNGYVMLNIQYNWNNATNKWQEQTKRDYEYNNADGMIYCIYNWDNITSSWVGVYKHEYSYDSSGRQTMHAYYRWQTNNWIGEEKREFTFDDKGNQTMYIYYTWNNNTWIEDAKHKDEYTYNTNETIHASFTWKNNAWIEDYKNKTEFSYDENNKPTMYAYYVWDYTTNAWEGAYKNEYTSDDDGRKLNISYNWDNSTNDWKMVSKLEQVFDLSYSITDLIVPIFLYYDFWYERTYVYNFDNMLTEEISYTQSVPDWIQSGVVTWYWSGNNIETGISEITNSSMTITVYPNPTNEQITINGQLTNENYEIYNLTGQLQKQGKLQGESTNINIESLANGMYFLRIARETVKIIKE